MGILDQLIQAAQEAARNITVTRYFSIAGYTLLLYDWLLLLSDEFRLIWQAKRSIVKWTFLAEKYAVMVILFLVNFELSGLSGVIFSDNFCRSWLAFHVIWGTLSIQVANALVLLRVAALWEHRRLIAIILWTIFFSTTISAAVTVSVGVGRLISTVTFIPEFKFCGPSLDAHVSFFAIVWGIPLVLDVTIIALTALNTLDRPRNMDTPLSKLLAQDGLFYFLAIGALHLFNVLMIGLAPITLVFCGGYFAWAMATLLMNRVFINAHEREAIAAAAFRDGRSTSHLEIPLSSIENGGGLMVRQEVIVQTSPTRTSHDLDDLVGSYLPKIR